MKVQINDSKYKAKPLKQISLNKTSTVISFGIDRTGLLPWKAYFINMFFSYPSYDTKQGNIVARYLSGAPLRYSYKRISELPDNILETYTDSAFRGVGKNFIFEIYHHDADLDEDEPEQRTTLSYADGIKLFYHYYETFIYYADNYISDKYWKTLIGYKVNINTTQQTITITTEEYEYLQRGMKVKLINEGSLTDRTLTDLEILEPIYERHWYKFFKEKIFPAFKAEYDRLVDQGEIDEGDVVVYEE